MPGAFTLAHSRAASRLARRAGLLAILAACGSNHPPPTFNPPGDAAVVPSLDSGPSQICGNGSDCDGDGYSPPADCDDYAATVNPEAYDFIGNGIDDDCDGQVDNPVVTCETIPAQAPGSPTDFARAGDLCAQRSVTLAGTVFDPLVRAEWGQVKGTGGAQVYISQTKTQQVNIVSSFGQNAPRQGKTMVGLSNGPWGATDPRASPALDPAGFHLDNACADIPLAGLDCASLSGGSGSSAGLSVQDWAELTLWVKVPSNATSMHFDFAFFSSEFNQWWNSSANDAFFVLVSSKTISGANVARDAQGLGVTVNSSFFQLCPAPPGPAGLSQDKAGGLLQCVGVGGNAAQGIFGTLAGTGYDGAAVGPSDTALAVNGNEYIYGGGSGWLTATFAVTPREEFQMRIVVMDTFDGLKDSVVVVDRLGWDEGAPAGVVRPPR